VTTAPSGRVLVLGDSDLAALAIVRSLGRLGLDVHLASFEGSLVTRHSRYVAQRHALGHPLEDEAGFVDALRRLLAATPFDLVVPTSDKSLVPLMAYRDEIARLSRFVAPSDRGFRVTNRKDETIALAASCGLRVPQTVRVENPAEADRVAFPFSYPVVLKPIVSHIAGRAERLRVRLVHSPDELAQRLPEMAAASPVLVQELCPGTGLGLSVLAHRGEVTAAFQHERVHEPPEGGAGSYRRSAPLSKDLLEGVQRFCREVEWDGPAMFEFKRHAGGVPALMEVNGRFWGSLALAVHAGVDFPRLLYESVVLGRTTRVFDYRVPLYVRHTVRDVSWLYSNARASMSQGELIRVPLSQLAREALNLPCGRERFDLESISDPVPAFMGWLALAGELSTGVRRRAAEHLHLLAVRRRMERLRRSPALAERIRAARSVLFVCQGNINRSAVAERVLSERFRASSNGPAVASAGFDPRPGRRSTSISRGAANDLHVDLQNHVSTPLIREMLTRFDLIVAMELRQAARIGQLDARAGRHCIVLALLDPEGGPLDIPDPDGKARAMFSTVYARIVRCVEQLHTVMSSGAASPAAAGPGRAPLANLNANGR
jgi:predicted ATP-grasp superfamily ATP-dependent carboligase/protein-tyrosine-phosphatase